MYEHIMKSQSHPLITSVTLVSCARAFFCPFVSVVLFKTVKVVAAYAFST